MSSPSTTGSRPEATPASGLNYEKFLDCVHCGLCTSACPTYLETGDENDSPRGRIYLMRAVTDKRINLTPAVEKHLDLCLDCRSCETACPSGVEYGRLIEPFRVAMHEGSGKPSGGLFEKLILHGLFPYPNRLKWALLPARFLQWTKLDQLFDRIGLTRLIPGKLGRMQRLLPQLKPALPQLPEYLPAIGERRASVALFTGCVAEAMFSHVNWATARVLQRNGCDVHIPRSQGCCGAIHYHSGSSAPAMNLAATNARAFDEKSFDAVIVNVAGCGSMLKDYGDIAKELTSDSQQHKLLNQFASKVKDISEFLFELGPIPPTKPLPLRATYHDACHLCHAQQIRVQPRSLLSLIPELEVVDLAESEICCGAAGSYNLTQPDMADRLGERKVNNILSTDPQTLITANAGCALQIQAMLKEKGRSNIEVVHPIELLDRSYGEVKS